MTAGNVLRAFVISSNFTIVVATAYIFYPILVAVVGYGEGAETGAAGKGSSILFIIIEPILFLVIFAFLQRKSKKNLS